MSDNYVSIEDSSQADGQWSALFKSSPDVSKFIKYIVTLPTSLFTLSLFDLKASLQLSIHPPTLQDHCNHKTPSSDALHVMYPIL